MIAQTGAVVTLGTPSTLDPPFIQPIPRVHRLWSVAALAIGVIVNLCWVGFLGYGFFKLVEPVFF